MNSDPGILNQNARLLDFTARFLKENGALVEQEPRGINVLLPGDLAARLGTKEYITLGTLERYDPDTDAWTTLAPLPQPSGGLAGAALNGTLYVFGGEYFSDGGGVYEHTWAYDPQADAWTELPPMRTPRHTAKRPVC